MEAVLPNVAAPEVPCPATPPTPQARHGQNEGRIVRGRTKVRDSEGTDQSEGYHVLQNGKHI